MMSQPVSNLKIMECLKINYGINVKTLTVLPLGADLNSFVYRAEAHSTYFVKVKQGHHHDIGISILDLLHKANIQQIIPPLITKNNKATQHLDAFTLVVYPFVEGQNGFTQALTEHQWFTLGKALKQIHELNVPYSLQQQLSRESFSPQWRHLARSICYQIDAMSFGDEIALKLLSFMKENITAIHRLIDRAEVLGNILKNGPPPSVLCHSDIHAGNIIIDNNNFLYIVDWDEPIMAPKERDLMFIGGGVGNVWNNLKEEENFYKGYGTTDINMTMLTYYRHERIVEDIAVYAQQLLLADSGGENRLQMYQHFIEMFNPNGVVEIAFNTDTKLLQNIQ